MKSYIDIDIRPISDVSINIGTAPPPGVLSCVSLVWQWVWDLGRIFYLISDTCCLDHLPLVHLVDFSLSTHVLKPGH